MDGIGRHKLNQTLILLEVVKYDRVEYAAAQRRNLNLSALRAPAG